MTITVTDNATDHRHELPIDGELVLAAYERRGETLVFTQTGVPAALEGKGAGSRLITGALQDVRKKGETIIAKCGFVSTYFERHPEQQDLMA